MTFKVMKRLFLVRNRVHNSNNKRNAVKEQSYKKVKLSEEKRKYNVTIMRYFLGATISAFAKAKNFLPNMARYC